MSPQTARAYTQEEIVKEVLAHPSILVAERCRRSLFYTMKTFWSALNPSAEPVWNWHIPYLANELELVARRVGNHMPKEYDLFINIPPGTTKSLLVNVMFPVWCWTNWYWMRFISVSYSAELSLELAEKSRDVISSQLFKTLFPELTLRRDKASKGNFCLELQTYDERGKPKEILRGGNRYSTSVGGTVTGFHGDILLSDDPINPSQALSPKELDSTITWLDNTLPTRKTDKEMTPLICIMQRLHQKDPTGHATSKPDANIRHISLPGEIRNFKDQLKPPELEKEYVDDLLDPIRMPWRVMREMKNDLGQYGFSGQVGQNPSPPGFGMFLTDMFVHMESMPTDINIDWVLRYWDKAGTDDGGAWTVGVKLIKLHPFRDSREPRWLVADVVRFQKESHKRERIIKNTAIADGPNVIVRFEQEPGSSGKDVARATTANLSGFVAVPDNPSGNKVHRADPWSVQVNEGNVYLLRAPWNEVYVDEHKWFPFSEFKDQVDASAGAFSCMTWKKLARVLGRSKSR